MWKLGGLVGALLVSMMLFGGSDAVFAATLKANYQLQDSYASQVPGAPNLVDLGSGNRFTTETVDGAARRVLRFPRGGGVSLSMTGLVNPSSLSIVMVFRLAELSGFRRLLDFDAGEADRGLYNFDGRVVVYPGDGPPGRGGARTAPYSYVQVSLTTERTSAGTQWTVVYLNGSPVAATAEGLRLESDVLRFFKDNVRGPGGGEEASGALACVLVYDGALSAAEVGQQAAAGAPCPTPRPAPLPLLPFRPGTYRGTTSQGLPIWFVVGQTSVEEVTFGWRAKCADGRIHTNSILLDGGPIRDRRFSVGGVLGTGGRARVSGRLSGDRASGRLSRWANSAFNTVCVARGVRWRARLVRNGS